MIPATKTFLAGRQCATGQRTRIPALPNAESTEQDVPVMHIGPADETGEERDVAALPESPGNGIQYSTHDDVYADWRGCFAGAYPIFFDVVGLLRNVVAIVCFHHLETSRLIESMISTVRIL